MVGPKLTRILSSTPFGLPMAWQKIGSNLEQLRQHLTSHQVCGVMRGYFSNTEALILTCNIMEMFGRKSKSSRISGMTMNSIMISMATGMTLRHSKLQRQQKRKLSMAWPQVLDAHLRS